MIDLPRPALERSRLIVERYLNGQGPAPRALRETLLSSTATGTPCESRTLRIPAAVRESAHDDARRRRLVHDALVSTLAAAPLPPEAHAVLHGSFATGDITPFSDVDIVLIIAGSTPDAEWPRLKASCARLLRVAYREAPLAHHGLRVVFMEELRRYDQSLLPLSALENGTHISSAPLELEVRWDRELSRASARARFAAQIEATRRNFARTSPLLYRRHSALSVLMLLPSLLLEALDGVFPYKRDSFALAKPRFDRVEWSAIEMASAARRAWRLPSHLARAASLLNRSSSPLSPEIGRLIVGGLSWHPASSWDAPLPRAAIAFADRCDELLHAAA